MRNRIVIVDYGVGNLFSVRRAVEVCGGSDIVVSASPADILTSDRVILPGVGAFEDGMRGLRDRDLISPLVDYAASGKPLLGICLGMQLLATTSEEFGHHVGLGLVPGRVVPIPRVDTAGRPLKVPSIGWANLSVPEGSASVGSYLEAHELETALYLVHSFHLVPDQRQHLLATYCFGGHLITAAVRRGNISGFQFHPEKSGPAGLEIVSRFVAAQ
jgi:glutamine amidotransferase